MFSKSSKYFFDLDAIRESVAEGDASAGNRNYRADAGRIAAGQTMVNFRKDRGIDVPGSPMFRGGSHNSGLAAGGGCGNWRQKRDVWWISSEPLKDEHYAAFPTKLVEPCVLAGTSEKGVCPTCGKPWERLRMVAGQTVSDEVKIAALALKGVPRTTANLYATSGQPRGQTTTIGWQQTCSCPKHIPVPATVLDTFSGSGTVGVVCLRTGRNFIGIDLKPEYHDIARRRLGCEASRQSKLSTKAIVESREEVC